MGRPEEYFWRWQEAQWASRFGVPVPDGPHCGLPDVALSRGMSERDGGLCGLWRRRWAWTGL